MVPRRKTPGTQILDNDDGWWDSVFADEDRHGQIKSAHQIKPNNSPKSLPDWTKVKTFFNQDAIVTLRVNGYNRGGLLVEGDNINGFVPYSHLVEVAAQSDLDNREKALLAYLGQELRLKVIECVPEDGRIIFSERAAQTEAGRRTEIFRSLEQGQRLCGEVTNITDFGVFVDLGGVEGLIHISELSWGRVSHPSQIVKFGQHIEIKVMDVSLERGRIALSLKRLSENPWEAVEKHYVINQIVSAMITGIVSFGAFARLEDGLEGLIHATEIPLSAGTSIKDFLHEGQKIQVRIINIDAEHQRIGLSLKLNE